MSHIYYYTLNSLSLFWLAESVQWIFEINTSDVIPADYTIIMSGTFKVTCNHVMYYRGAWYLRVMMSSSRAFWRLPSPKKQKHEVWFRSMHNKTILRFGFCDIQNNQGPWLFWISQKPHPIIAYQRDTSVGQRNSESPSGTHNLPNTWRTLYPLNYENSWRSRSFNWVHMWQVTCILLGSAVIVSSNKWIKMMNLKLGNEMWKVNRSTMHERGTKNRIYDPPNTWRALYPLSYEKSWRVKTH